MPDEPTLNPAAAQRAARLSEIIEHALAVITARSGSAIGAHRRLSDALSCSVTMLTRYKQGTDFDNLKCGTVRQLAAVTGLDPGVLYTWVASGREAAIAQQRLLEQTPVAFSPLDLLKELEHALKRTTAVAAAHQEQPQTEPVLQAAAIAAELQQLHDQAPELLQRLAAALQIEHLLASIEQRTALDEREWSALAQLFGTTTEQLQQRFLR